MLKMLSAFTYEVDDINDAVTEILEQLDINNNLRKNSVGFINCYSEFVETGVVKAVCNALPFEVIGCTSISASVAGESGMLIFTISVLTSDDVTFSVAMTDSLINGMESITDAYSQALNRCSVPPNMVFTYFPLITNLGGEILLESLNSASGGIPIFGSSACDHLVDYSTTYVICNGEAKRDSAAFALICGDVSPKFFIASIPDKKLQTERAVITKSEGAVLIEVNNRPAMEYLRDIGLAQNDGFEGLTAIPFMVDYNDGTGTPAVARAMYVHNETGIVCGGNMPEGSLLTVGSLDDQGVLETAEQAIKQAASAGGSCAFMYPCLSRILALGMDNNREFNTAIKNIGNISYHSCYSGGEICPVLNKDGMPVNRFHNFTMACCVLS